MKVFMTGNVFPIGKHIAYGGERIVYYLIEALANMGVDVYAFVREGSDLSDIPIRSYVPIGPLSGDFDVHYDAVLKYVQKTGIKPDVYQCNYFGDGWNEACQQYGYCELTWCKWSHAAFQGKGEHYNVIAYSKRLQQDFADHGVPTVMIHYGIPKDLYQFEPEHDNYAVWIGKIEGGKAPQLAIEVALAAGLKIVLMGPPYNTGCFWQHVAPYLEKYPDKVFWVRGVDDAQKRRIMSRAKVFISSNDNTWREHFGIVNIEALAMGVPILAFNRMFFDCAIVSDEIIKDGEHGFVLTYVSSDHVDFIKGQGVAYIEKLDQIDRKACREQFERNFTAELMAKRYLCLYERIMRGEKLLGSDLSFIGATDDLHV
jgi:glycosyltransferase involved in cell wall biosynthesis